MNKIGTLLGAVAIVVAGALGATFIDEVASRKPEPVIKPKPEAIKPNQINIWSASTPGTIFITSTVSDATFESFYKQTMYDLDHYRIVLNTNGGGAHACIGIMTRIQELQARGVYITTEVYSKAFSAGAFIWMMGDRRIMHTGAQLMWHTIEPQQAYAGTDIYERVSLERIDSLTLADAWVWNMTKRQMNLVDPMTLETMLLYTGMTFMDAEQAKELGMLTEYVSN